MFKGVNAVNSTIVIILSNPIKVKKKQVKSLQDLILETTRKRAEDTVCKVSRPGHVCGGGVVGCCSILVTTSCE